MTRILPKIKLSATSLFWVVYIGFLLMLWPQEAWTIGQSQDQNAGTWTMLGVTASPLAWLLAGALGATIGIVTHKLNEHWKEMPSRYKAKDMEKQRFAYRWLNVYVLGLFATILLSAIANFMHVVEFTNPGLQVFAIWPWAKWIYQVLFGLALPLVSMVFARVLSTMRADEQEEDPALTKAKTELADAKKAEREKEKTIRQMTETILTLEQKIAESESLIGRSVVRYLYDKELALRERIQGVRRAFPELSQNGISQLLECSVSTVNDALKGFEIIDMEAK